MHLDLLIPQSKPIKLIDQVVLIVKSSQIVLIKGTSGLQIHLFKVVEGIRDNYE